MKVVQVHLPHHLKEVINRQIAEGSFASESEFLLEAARRYAEDLELERLQSEAAHRYVEDIELEDNVAAEVKAGFR